MLLLRFASYFVEDRELNLWNVKSLFKVIKIEINPQEHLLEKSLLEPVSFIYHNVLNTM